MKLIVPALLVLFMALRAGATPDASQFSAKPAPAGVLSQMKDGGHSVLFEQVDTGPGEKKLFCHIYTVDKNYFLDSFRPEGKGAFHSLNSVDLGDTPHSTQLQVSFMWLQPKHHNGPILQLFDQDFPGEWDASYELLVFPDGFEGRVAQQRYLEKILGGMAINPSFDSYDERGLLVVNLWDVYEVQLQSHVRLYWNGQGFVERPPRYAIISPFFRTYGEAKKYLKRPALKASDQIIAKPVIQPTRFYKEKGLTPDRIVVVLNYLDSQTDASSVAAAMQQQNIPCSVLRLY